MEPQTSDPAMMITEYLKKVGYRPRGIVHVGAHLAQEMESYCSIGVDRVIWIEADPVLATRLTEIVASFSSPCKQYVVQALVTDRDGDVLPFYRFSNDGESSSIFRSTEKLHENWPTVRETGDVVELFTSRLDTILKSLLIEPHKIDVIVFDIQGSELQALNGAGVFLDAALFVESEVSCEPIYEGAPLVQNVIDRLAQSGFVPVTEIPWHGDLIFSKKFRG